MLSKVCSAAVSGIDAYPVEVEVNAGYGDTLLVIVGLPDAAVKESRDRVMTALINSGFSFTFGRTTINLAPAHLKKEGPNFDLPIALGVLAASEQMVTDQLHDFIMVGELALNGAVRPVKGVLPIAMSVKKKFTIKPEYLEGVKEDMVILHPLPKIDEIPPEVDKSPHARYFDQAKNGIPMRMAIMKKMLTG